MRRRNLGRWLDDLLRDGPRKPEPKDPNQVETHVIEFSVNTSKEGVKRLCANSGLTVDPNFGLSNGGVTFGLRITGPRNILKKLVRRCGYAGQNPDLE